MTSEVNDQIHSTEIKIGHLKLSAGDKDKLNNLDEWATNKDRNGIITSQYVE